MPGMSPEARRHAPVRSLERANRTRFPFFSDVKGDHRLVLNAVETVVLALIFVVSLLGNVCAFVGSAPTAPRHHRQPGAQSFLRGPAFTVAPSRSCWLCAGRRPGLWPGACHLLFYMMTLSGSVTIFTLAAVSRARGVHRARAAWRAGPRAAGAAALLALIWATDDDRAAPLHLLFRVLPQRLPGADQVSAALCALAGVREGLAGGMCDGDGDLR